MSTDPTSLSTPRSRHCSADGVSLYEDELDEAYPYGCMYVRSRVIDGVRMFPPVPQCPECGGVEYDEASACRGQMVCESCGTEVNAHGEGRDVCGDPECKWCG